MEGFGVFEAGSNEPDDVEDLWPSMNEPELRKAHQARIEPVDDANNRTLLWAVGGLVVGFGGIGAAAAIGDESPTLAAAAGITGGAALLVGAVGALASQPSGRDQVEADARRKLFIPGEDDAVAVQRGVDRLNGHRRAQCGGKPLPFASPHPPATQSARPPPPPPSPPPPSPPPPSPSSR